LKDLIADQVDAALIERNWDDLRRLAESIREGKVSTSLLVGKLAAYPHHSELALACANWVALNELCSRWTGFSNQNSAGGPTAV
jgi:TnpA family transposase